MPMPEQFTDLAKRVNNWGRWGADDERGTLNLITDERVVHAASLIRTGKRFSLALPLDENGPQIGMIPGRDNPKRSMIMVNAPVMGEQHEFRTSDDRVVIGRIDNAAARLDAEAAQLHAGFVQRLLDRIQRLLAPQVEFDTLNAGRVCGANAGREIVVPFHEHPFNTSCKLHDYLSLSE